MPASVLLSPSKPAPGSVLCFHCHSVCVDEPLHSGDHDFCCPGCKLVYEILHEHDLCEYYALDKNAGQSLKSRAFTKSYAFLDDAEIQDKLIEFQQGDTAQVTFYLPHMHCVSCIWLLENFYKLDRGVIHSKVNFLKKTATIQFNTTRSSLRKLATLLDSIGYQPDINLGDVDNAAPPLISRRIAYQLGVAGFAFGNVMLFSFPEYVGMDRSTDPWFSSAFGYISLILALPVLIFSARDYFVSAWQGLRERQLNINIPLCLALLSLFGRSVWEILTHTGAGYLDSFCGLTFLLLTGKWFQQQVWHQLSFERDYKSYFPVAATLRKGNEETDVPVNRLIPGDIILVRNQEIIPADGILLKNTARIDYSFVTGESEAVTVYSGERIFAGGKQLGGNIEITLTRRVSQSHLTELWNNEAFKRNTKGSTTKLADDAGRYFTMIILAFGTAASAYWYGWRGDMATAVNAFTAIMIVACPCTVALAIPFTLGNILRILGRHRFYLKNSQVVEAFAGLDAVVFDKTGTITNVSDQQIVFRGAELSYRDKTAIRSLAHHSGHPLSRRIDRFLADVATETPEHYEEQPGLGISANLQGRYIRIGSAEFIGVESVEPGVYVSIAGVYRGYFEMKNTYRSGLGKVLRFFRRQANVFLLSGDRDREAADLAPFFPESDTMFFNRSPQDKLDFVKKLQQKGKRVLMLGDGLNDAGALRQSDLGIVVAENTNNFTPACDAILHAGEFERLPDFVRLARRGVSIVHQSYIVALTYNAIGLTFAVSGTLSPLVAAVLMPLSSVSIVLFGVGMGNLAARKILGKRIPLAAIAAD